MEKRFYSLLQQSATDLMRVFGPGDQPFLCEDTVLSFALYFAFQNFFDDEQPCVNYYTLDMLKQFGYKGLLPAPAALRAVEERHRGKLTYVFKPPSDELLRAYEDQKLVLKEAEGTARDMVKNLIGDFAAGARSYNETIIRLICIIVHMRPEFCNMWQQYEPLIRIEEQATQSMEDLPDGSKLLTHSGFKFIGAKASEETKKRMGLC